MPRVIYPEFGVIPWCRSVLLGSIESEHPNIIFEAFQPTWPWHLTSQTDGRLAVAIPRSA